jgi:hypothetical protein
MKNLATFCLLIGAVWFFSAGFVPATNGMNEASEPRCAVQKFDAAYKNAKAVFIGEVVGEEQDGDRKIFEFKVKKFWKGIEETRVKITVYESPRYQAPYETGETHLVFAGENEDGELTDGRCSRSKDLKGTSADLDEDLKSLGEGKTCIGLADGEENKEN